MITLESEQARLEVDPAFGARVTAFWDKRTGREWLVAGPREGDPSDQAAYAAAEARGWDECFPTVAACSHASWGGLRDHGLLWGRPWVVFACGQTVRASYRDPRFIFSRVLDLHGATLYASYEIENTGDTPLPWMWSQHCLLAARPGERIALDGFWDVRAEGKLLAWPQGGARDLSLVGEASDRFALKVYARAIGRVRAALESDLGGLAFEWEEDQIPALGLWLDWGGWPEGCPVHQLAIEPTTAPFDNLAEAAAAGEARVLGPGETASWRMTLTLIPAP